MHAVRPPSAEELLSVLAPFSRISYRMRGICLELSTVLPYEKTVDIIVTGSSIIIDTGRARVEAPYTGFAVACTRAMRIDGGARCTYSEVVVTRCPWGTSLTLL